MVSSASSRGVNAARRVAAPVDAVAAVEGTHVGHQHLQQGDAAPVGGKTVAASGDGGGCVADHPGPGAAPHTAGGAGRIVFGRVRQDGQFLQNVHLTLRRAAAMAGSRLIDMVDEPHHVSGYGASAQQGNQQSDGSHGSYLRIKLMFYFTL